MRKLVKIVSVAADPTAVWDAWTTVEGVTSFFAPGARIALRPGGDYEILFDLAAPPGEQGAEGCKVLSLLPKRMLSFAWNAPPAFPSLRTRGPITWVVIEIGRLPDGTSRVRLTHLGWRKGDDWKAMYEYFDKAWTVVMERLAKRFAEGPIDWSAA